MSIMNAEMYDALIAAGAPDNKARAAAVSISEDSLATKRDIVDLKADIAEVKTDIARLEGKVKTDIAATKAEILKWMFAAMIGQTAVIAALVRLLPAGAQP